jgi:hypothetical protein
MTTEEINKIIFLLELIKNRPEYKSVEGLIKKTIITLAEMEEPATTKKNNQYYIMKHSTELAKILFSNPLGTSGKAAQELIEEYFKKEFK